MYTREKDVFNYIWIGQGKLVRGLPLELRDKGMLRNFPDKQNKKDGLSSI